MLDFGSLKGELTEVRLFCGRSVFRTHAKIPLLQGAGAGGLNRGLGKPLLETVPISLAFEDPEIKRDVISFESCFLMLFCENKTGSRSFVPIAQV